MVSKFYRCQKFGIKFIFNKHIYKIFSFNHYIKSRFGYRKPLPFAFNFAMNLKLLLKKNYLKNPSLTYEKVIETHLKLKCHPEHYIENYWKCLKVDALRIHCHTTWLAAFYYLIIWGKNEFLLESSYLKHPFNASVTVSYLLQVEWHNTPKTESPNNNRKQPGLNTHGEKKAMTPMLYLFLQI